MKICIRKKKLIESDEYILWLQNFTTIYESFGDDDWIYCKNEISSKDLENVGYLHLLYDIIDKYARENYISATPCPFENSYSIMFSGVGYNIRQLIGQGTFTICIRVHIDNEDNFINFEDIKSNKKCDEAVVIDEKLQELSGSIKKLVKEENVPRDAISTCVEETLVKLK